MFLAERYEQVAFDIAAATRQRRDSVRILLVSKYQSCEDIYSALDYLHRRTPQLEAAQLDLPNLGENYVQGAAQRQLELEQYYAQRPQFVARRVRLEMIGALQSNKASKATELFCALHSVSSVKLLRRLAKAVAGRDRTEPLDLYFQYNASGEKQKNGCREYDELCQLLDELLGSGSLLRLRGLMCMGAANVDEAATRRAFASCRRLAERLWCDYPPTQSAGHQRECFELSMGMSSDYREALAEGANVLRIGSLLFCN